METEIVFLLKILLSAFLGGVVGFERERTHRPAGLRTHMIVCLSSCLITLVSMNASYNSDPLRIAANVITGVGFIGAGTIIASSGNVKGVTTAATIFAVAGIGIAVAAGFYLTAVFSTLLIFGILELKKLENKDLRFFGY
jgi:putative Mg2+ transporter-C (MgtC) family protein